MMKGSNVLEQEFSKARGKVLTFVEMSKKKSTRYSGNTIVIVKDDNYVDIEGIEYLPYKNMLINPLDTSKRNITYRKIDDESNVNLSNVSKMRYDDPVRIWKGYRRGDIIEVKRSNGSIAYRQVE